MYQAVLYFRNNRTKKTIGFALFCGLAFLYLSLLPAHADLVLDDNTPHKDLWTKVYSSLPPSWRTIKKIVVEVVSKQEMQSLFEQTWGHPSNEKVDGCYYLGGDRLDADATILLLNTLDEVDAQKVFAHEYGHFVWDHLLSQEDRERYTIVWSAQRNRHCLVTPYAYTSVEEGFAEAFADYLFQRAQLHTADPRSERFLSQLASDNRYKTLATSP